MRPILFPIILLSACYVNGEGASCIDFFGGGDNCDFPDSSDETGEDANGEVSPCEAIEPYASALGTFNGMIEIRPDAPTPAWYGPSNAVMGWSFFGGDLAWGWAWNVPPSGIGDRAVLAAPISQGGFHELSIGGSNPSPASLPAAPGFVVQWILTEGASIPTVEIDAFAPETIPTQSLVMPDGESWIHFGVSTSNVFDWIAWGGPFGVRGTAQDVGISGNAAPEVEGTSNWSDTSSAGIAWWPSMGACYFFMLEGLDEG